MHIYMNCGLDYTEFGGKPIASNIERQTLYMDLVEP